MTYREAVGTMSYEWLRRQGTPLSHAQLRRDAVFAVLAVVVQVVLNAPVPNPSGGAGRDCVPKKSRHEAAVSVLVAFLVATTSVLLVSRPHEERVQQVHLLFVVTQSAWQLRGGLATHAHLRRGRCPYEVAAYVLLGAGTLASVYSAATTYNRYPPAFSSSASNHRGQ